MIWAFQCKSENTPKTLNGLDDTPKKSFSYYGNPEDILIIIFPEMIIFRFSFNFVNFSVNF